ncbi:MAG: hypothetical protein QOC60_456 [Frankiaceae bacterium]|nr:hypothetical protein [Frankiaceae bacterium]
MKPSRKPLVVLALASLALVPLGGAIAQAATSNGTVSIAQTFTWYSGSHDCASPPADMVICLTGSAVVPGLGTLDYARYAQNAPGLTKDGCSRLSTHGTIWVAGGTAEFDGPPASTCGQGTTAAKPDAHYVYKILKGTGVLAGASGIGDLVADHGVDIWKGTLVAPGLKGMTVPLTSAAPSPSTVDATTGSAVPSATEATPSASPSASPVASIVPAAVASNSASTGSSATLWLVLGIVAAVAIVVGLALARRRGSASGRP